MIKGDDLLCDKCGNLLVTVNIIKVDFQSNKINRQIVVPQGGFNVYVDKTTPDTVFANCHKCGTATSFPKAFLGVK